MQSSFSFEIIAVLVLILANGFFVLAEFSIIASRKTKLKQKVDEGKPGAEAALKLHDKPDLFLATIQVGITLVGALVGVFSGATIVERLHALLNVSGIPFVERWAEPISVGIIVLSITVLTAVIGELVPKYIALSYPEKYARLIARPTRVFVAITYFIAEFLGWLSRRIVRTLGIRRRELQSVIDEDEINHMILEGREKGLFDVTEEEFVKSVFQFTDTAVRRAMKPRPDIAAIDIDAAPAETAHVIIDNGYSRYPVYRDSIDNIIGLVYIKDLIKDGVDPGNLDVQKVMRPPLFVPDSMPLTKLLQEFQVGKNHLAIVLDEYGGTAGIITLEDILEELVGEIQDEYDSEAPPVVRISETVVYAGGDVWPGEINELLDTDLPEDKSDTLAGLFVDESGRMPDKYQAVTIADARMTILSKDKHRILRLKVEKVSRAEDD
ncbi:hypothetical protein C3F09_04180 [candidate division GN15 bacterium]|uniref:HlyC/CorC family transporter n=1 Tax=candidate division GN15 bacterium TaxID=2072418 RepID=A0A855X4Z0_9BACT|nr:MAG: hypothetical protein C3F09_04180 [candidate division GN15 bacterium]